MPNVQQQCEIINVRVVKCQSFDMENSNDAIFDFDTNVDNMSTAARTAALLT